MRVVDVTQWYAPRSGGIRTYLTAKAAHAARAALDHALIVPGAAAGVTRLARSPVIAVPGLPTGQSAGYRLIPHPAPIERALDRLAPAVLVLHDATAFPRSLGRWARAHNAAVVLFVHSDLETAAPGAPAPLRRPATHALRALQARGLVGPDAVVTTSQAMAARLRAHHGAQVHVSPLGVDTDLFRPAPADTELRRTLAAPRQTLLVHAGRLSPEKHPLLLVETLARLPTDHVLVIAGDGAKAPAMRDHARRLGVADRLRILGHVPERAHLARLLATADCFLHANPGEPFGLAPLEALACGCRVVLPADCGAAERMPPTSAVRVAPGSAAALAAGVERALAGPRPDPDLASLSWTASFAREWALYRHLRIQMAAGCDAA